MAQITLHTPIEDALSGVGKRFLRQLKRLGIETVKNLLWHFPIRYEDRSEMVGVDELKAGEEVTVQGIVQRTNTRRIPYRRLTITEVGIVDESGRPLTLTFFNQPYIANTLREGKLANFSGKVKVYKGKPTIQSPVYELVEIRGQIRETQHTGRLVPIYPETKGLTSRGLRFIIKPILDQLGALPEYIPATILQKLGLPDVNEALPAIHFPEESAAATRALKSFAFRDLFLLQLKNSEERQRLHELQAHPINWESSELIKIVSYLPFALTTSQKQTLQEILTDLKKSHPMNRLLQGDVGSGKTIVAGIAALLTVRQNHQVAFMAPTEILARQHYRTLTKFFEEYDGGIALLVAKEAKIFYGTSLEQELKKIDLQKRIAEGKVGIVVGTHALIQKSVRFRDLGFVVVDEQHRFGVHQRAEIARGIDITPHFLSMSATPIPRTLTMTIFGNLDVSLINELPTGRKAIVTRIVEPAKRPAAYEFIRDQVRAGRQVFVICPRIEESDVDQGLAGRQKTAWDVKAVKAEYEKLSKQVFPDLRVAMLHGKLKTSEKKELMQNFATGKTDILISTSVVEVGVDIPNATVMLIEGADRFGLAQLYQFRGRVGRGEHQSYCLLLTDSRSENTKRRLEALVKAENGFALAELDLELRGPGEFLGETQTGMPDLALKALQNPDMLRIAREEAETLLKEDPELQSYPLLAKKLTQFKREVHLE